MRVSRALGVALAVALTLALIAPAGIGAVGASTAGAADFQALDGAQPPAGFSIANVLANLDQGPGGNPTVFAFAPDGRIFVARKTGVLDVYDHGVKHVYADLRTEVNTYQSRGFIGLALDPNFAVNDRVYLMFTQELNPGDPDSPAPAGGQLISLESKAGQPNVSDPASRVTLVTGIDSTATLHSVAGLRFGNDGSLFVGIGDGNGNGVGTGTSIKAEDLDLLNGKILRIDPVTGRGVPSNPYYQPGNPDSVRSRVFAPRVPQSLPLHHRSHERHALRGRRRVEQVGDVPGLPPLRFEPRREPKRGLAVLRGWQRRVARAARLRGRSFDERDLPRDLHARAGRDRTGCAGAVVRLPARHSRR